VAVEHVLLPVEVAALPATADGDWDWEALATSWLRRYFPRRRDGHGFRREEIRRGQSWDITKCPCTVWLL
jgi:hypothetical protein